MPLIPLTQGKFAIVDACDFAELSRFRWRAQLKTGYACAYRTAYRPVKRRQTVYMHRHILGLKLGDPRQCDHINGDPLDNRRVNLRVATRSQNAWNSKKRRNNKSGYKGVYQVRRCRGFVAQIQVNGKNKYLGFFQRAMEAATAYDIAAKRLHKDFARINGQENKKGKR